MSKNFTFNTVPTIRMSRERQTGLSYDRLQSQNLGDLCPCYVEEVLPGDTFTIDTTAVIRLTSSFIRPPFANLFADIQFFFVPNRIIYNKWEQVFGENPNGYWDKNFVRAVVPGTYIDLSKCT